MRDDVIWRGLPTTVLICSVYFRLCSIRIAHYGYNYLITSTIYSLRTAHLYV